MGLDLSHLPNDLDFSTAKCPSCGALTNQSHRILKFLSESNKYNEYNEYKKDLACSICQYKEAFDYSNILKNYTLEDVYKLAKALSSLRQVCDPSIQRRTTKTPLFGLLNLLTMSSKFIHICTFSFDVPMLFVLKTISIRVPVVVVFNEKVNNSWLLEEIERSEKEDTNLQILQVSRDHQKLIVIDGLIAIKGSQNFTSRAWRNLQDNKEIADFETDVTKVRNLNNYYFASVVNEWRNLTGNYYNPIPF